MRAIQNGYPPAYMKLYSGKLLTLFSRIIVFSLIFLLAIIWIVPFLWVGVTSLKTMPEMSRVPVTFLPDNLFNFSNYVTLIGSGWLRYLLNSTIASVFGVFTSIFFSTLAGYAFAKLNFPGRNIAFILVLAILMMPFQVIVVPLFLLFNKISLLNTYPGLVGPQIMSAFGVFLMRQFIQSIPDDYLDAARIDGASEISVIWRIVVPLSAPGLITLGIIKFMWIWNDFLWPLIVISKDNMNTLTLGLASINTQAYVDNTMVAAAAVFSVIPMMVVFFSMQRYVTEGVVRAGLHG